MRPKTSNELVERMKALVPNYRNLEEEFKNPEKVVSRAFPSTRPKLRTRSVLEGIEEGVELAEETDIIEKSIQTEQKRIVETAGRAIAKINTEGPNAKLKSDEVNALEAIIHIEGRPAILIQNGKFFPPPSGWEILEEARSNVEKTCKSVGRIEVPGHYDLDWGGTGFLVADDVIMTNRHVAELFCHVGGAGVWEFKPWITPRIDYGEEFGTTTSKEFAIKEIIGIVAPPGPDLALLRVSPTNGEELPEPLVIASEVPEEVDGRRVYVLGYPAWDGRRNDPEPMRRIFNDIYGVKRLQPGETTKLQDLDINHNCSTLGGNSGSCVIDLETNLVIGLHYGGHYLDTNYAVALPLLKKDPLIKKAELNFN